MPPQRALLERQTWGGGFCALCLLLVAGLLSGCQASDTDNRLGRFFAELVFGSGDAYEGTSGRLVKWTGAVGFHLSGIDIAEHEPKLATALARFSALTGVAVAPATESAANLRIVFVPEESFEINQTTSSHETVPCAAAIKSGEQGIERAMIRISVAEEELIEECIAHELMHAFGFRHHSGLVRSALSPFHGKDTLTVWDETALKILYDPEIRHNAGRNAVMPIARRRISEFVAGR
ncbi:MAG: DUF2927 domain-containing protein [Kiloniellales bacterium]